MRTNVRDAHAELEAGNLRFRTYVWHFTALRPYLRANAGLLPFNLALTAGVLLFHFQPAWAR